MRHPWQVRFTLLLDALHSSKQMAASIRKIRHDDETPFYVYVIVENGLPIYVGKGSGKRFKVQCRKFGCNGYIAERYRSGIAAYRGEIKLIKELRPELNRHSGGNGGRSQKIAKKYKPEPPQSELRKIAAKLILEHQWKVPGLIAPENLAKIHSIALGA